MSTLAELRAAIAGAVNGRGDPPLHGYAYSPGQIVTPAAIVETDEVDWDGDTATFRRGNEAWELSVFVLVAAVANAQDVDGALKAAVDQFFDRSANDLREAIEAASKSYKVAGADRFGAFQFTGAVYVGFRLRVVAFN